jgi:hypothetical protein
MKQKQSQRVVVNINQAIKAKRKRRAKKAKARTQQPTQPPLFSPMPQSVIRYYDNTIPQRNITFNPPLVEQPKILGVAETEYAQPVRVERKPIKVPTPLPETEHVLLREEESVPLGGEEAPTARDVIEEQLAEEQPIEKKKKKKKEAREVPEEFRPTFTQAVEPFPVPPKFAPVLEPVAQENELEKGAEERNPRKTREPEQPWYKAVKKDFKQANEEERQYDIDDLKLTPAEAKRRYDRRRTNYIQSLGQDIGGFSFATAPVPNVEASGGGFSFVGK